MTKSGYESPSSAPGGELGASNCGVKSVHGPSESLFESVAAALDKYGHHTISHFLPQRKGAIHALEKATLDMFNARGVSLSIRRNFVKDSGVLTRKEMGTIAEDDGHDEVDRQEDEDADDDESGGRDGGDGVGDDGGKGVNAFTDLHKDTYVKILCGCVSGRMY
jgi:hypothetical protein